MSCCELESNICVAMRIVFCLILWGRAVNKTLSLCWIFPIESRSHFLHIIHDDKNFQQLFFMDSDWTCRVKLKYLFLLHTCFSPIVGIDHWHVVHRQSLYFRFVELIMSDVRGAEVIIQCHKMCFNLDSDKHVLEMVIFPSRWGIISLSWFTLPLHIQSVSTCFYLCASVQIVIWKSEAVTDSITSSAGLASSHHLCIKSTAAVIKCHTVIPWNDLGFIDKSLRYEKIEY